MQGFNVAILGAESTGKSTLAAAIVAHLQADNQPAALVPEYLREWCDAKDRTPRAHEQMQIAMEQSRRLLNATQQLISTAPHATHRFVVADTSPLMTAVYSDVYFNDTSLYPFALEAQSHFALTLLTGLDIAWTPDGLQRDSDAMRRTVDAQLRTVLNRHRIPYAMVYGQGGDRTQSALQAIAYRTAGERIGIARQSDWTWSCEKCSDAGCEHRMFSRLI